MVESFDYLIIGNGIAGVSAAETIRGEDASASIAIITDESHPLYSRVLLPNYVKGLIPREKVFLRKPEDYTAKRITCFTGVPAVHLDTADTTVHLADQRGFRFGKLLIASGGKPRSFGGGEVTPFGVSRFQTIEDADGIRSLLPQSHQALVVGGGFIALEFLDALSRAGVTTNLLIQEERFFERFLDSAGSTMLEENFFTHGVKEIIRGEKLTAIEGQDRVSAVTTESRKLIPCDFLGIGIGIEKSIGWLRTTDVSITPRGIFANEFLETTIPGIFAAGDVADFYDVITRRYRSHGNWSNAFLQGKTAGWNMVHPDGQQPFRSVPFYSITNLGFNIIFVGAVEIGQGVETTVRRDPEKGMYERFFIAEDRLVGAVIINRPPDKLAVTTLIERAHPLGAWRGQLHDASFNLASTISS